MRVTIKFSGEKYQPGDEYQERCEVLVDGKVIASGSNLAECPEDANLGRDLRFVYRLPAALMAAFQAGQNGESFDLDEIEHSED